MTSPLDNTDRQVLDILREAVGPVEPLLVGSRLAEFASRGIETTDELMLTDHPLGLSIGHGGHGASLELQINR